MNVDGVSVTQPAIKRTMDRIHTQVGSSLFVVVLWSILSTLAFGRRLTDGEEFVETPTVWELVFPACTLAATLGPPPIRRLRGLFPHPLIPDVKTASSSNVSDKRPDNGLNHFSVPTIDTPTEDGSKDIPYLPLHCFVVEHLMSLSRVSERVFYVSQPTGQVLGPSLEVTYLVCKNTHSAQVL